MRLSKMTKYLHNAGIGNIQNIPQYNCVFRVLKSDTRSKLERWRQAAICILSSSFQAVA